MADITPEALRIAFNRGQDDTHNSRDLPAGFGTRCWDIDLRSGIYEPRPGPAQFRNEDASWLLPVKRYPPLFLPIDLPSGQTSLLVVEPEANGAGTFHAPVFYKKLHFENEPDPAVHPGMNPWYNRAADRVVVMSRDNNGRFPHACQVTEPCEAAAYGNKLYVCNLNDPRWSAFATAEIDLRDMKAKTTAWPKARHICMSPSGHPVFLDVYARGPLSVEAADQPLSFTGEPTFGTNYDEIPGGAGDRNMKGIFHQNGLFIFQKRSCFVLWGPPPEWEHELVLNSVGTLSPSSVVSIGQHIYFLGNDGVVKRMTGEKGVVENVGAYTPDGRSPIENSLKGYYTKPSGEAGEHRYNAANWNNTEPERVKNFVRITDEGVTAEKDSVAGEEQTDATAGCDIPTDGDPAQRFYQTFRVEDASAFANGLLMRTWTVSIRFLQDGSSITLRARLHRHTDDAASDESLEILGEATATQSGDLGETKDLTFVFDDPALEKVLEIDPTPDWRVSIRAVGQTGICQLDYSVANVYLRGKFCRSDVLVGDMKFSSTFAYYYGTAANCYIGNTAIESGATWKLMSYVADIPEHTTLTAKMVDKDGVEREVENLGAIILDTNGNVKWRFHFTRDDAWPSRSAQLSDATFHYMKGALAGDEPFAVNWDGRYCLSLLRRDALKRDLFVWDNEAWSIWRADFQADQRYAGGGFHRMAVLPDATNRQRLVFFDPEKADDPCGFVNCLMADYPYCQSPMGWRMPVPQFISREMMIVGGMAGKVKESYLRYTDLGMTGRLWKGMSFDGADWQNPPDYLSQDLVVPPGTTNHEHLFAERPWPNEGRFCKAFIGFLDELPHGPGIPANALVKVQDWVLVPLAIGFREGLHTGA
jgi:hypothetical protein